MAEILHFDIKNTTGQSTYADAAHAADLHLHTQYEIIAPDEEILIQRKRKYLSSTIPAGSLTCPGFACRNDKRKRRQGQFSKLMKGLAGIKAQEGPCASAT
jgi:hypothetical protein